MSVIMAMEDAMILVLTMMEATSVPVMMDMN